MNNNTSLVAEKLDEITVRLARLEELICAPSKAEALSREVYSSTDASLLTEQFGIRTYAAYTIRRACCDGRLPEAIKADDGKTWLIPKIALSRILEEGLPPERR